MKYNLSEIMKNAWATYRSDRRLRELAPQQYRTSKPLAFADCLRMAWKKAKAIAACAISATKEAFTGSATINVPTCWGGIVEFAAKAWENYGKSRIYIEAGRTEKAYIDRADKSIHIIKSHGNLAQDAAERFLASYAI